MHESGEDYIETIYLLKKKKGVVRSIDVANELGFSRPSVSRGVGILKENGLVIIEDNVAKISARLIANTASLKLRKQEIEALADKMEQERAKMK